MTDGARPDDRDERSPPCDDSSARNMTALAGRRGFSPYQKYKPSGVEWLGDVPEHWEVRRLKHLARHPIVNGVGEAALYDEKEWPRYIRITDIAGPRELHVGTFRSLPPGTAAKAPVELNDILFAAVGATFGKSYFHTRTDNSTACFAGYLVRLSADDTQLVPEFAAYWTESRSYWSLVSSRVIKATIENFSAAKYRNLSIPLPTLREQATIVDYLNRETAKIDALIVRNEVLVEHLEEQRGALISRAVTRGLPPDESRRAGIDPYPKLKPSGVEWLGDVPDHWKVESLGAFGHFFKGSGGTRSDRSTTGVRCIRYGDIYTLYDCHFRTSSGFVSKQESSNYTQIRYGDVLFAGSGETIDEIGKSVANLVREHTCCGGDVIVFRPAPGVLDPVFSGYALDCTHASWQKSCMGRGVTVMHIYASELKHLIIPLPVRQEQEAIGAFLDRETAKIDKATTLARQETDLLREYRTRLISDVVTGKVDVRNSAGADVEAVE